MKVGAKTLECNSPCRPVDSKLSLVYRKADEFYWRQFSLKTYSTNALTFKVQIKGPHGSVQLVTI